MGQTEQNFTINGRSQLQVVAGLLIHELNAYNSGFVTPYSAHNGIDSKEGDVSIVNPARGIRVTYHKKSESDGGNIYITIKHSALTGNQNDGDSFEVSGKPITQGLVEKVQSALQIINSVGQNIR